jgi:hypothetical protein
MTTTTASRAANQMLRVTRLKFCAKVVYLFYEFSVRRHDEILHQNWFDALLDRDYSRQYHSPSRFGARYNTESGSDLGDPSVIRGARSLPLPVLYWRA